MQPDLDIQLSGPSGVCDARLPWLPAALDRAVVAPLLRRALAQPAPRWRMLSLDGIRLVRHKCGRRALIEYDLTVAGARGERVHTTLLGKMRAKGADVATHALHQALRAAGFGDDSPDRISVPAPLGLLPELGMWLQRKMPGQTLAEQFAAPQAASLARRVAAAAHKLHLAGLPAARSHTIDDELRILHERLEALAGQQPGWRERLLAILAACDRLGSTVATAAPRGIHRDFYPDQLLLAGERLYLLDLDLYCMGDPSLDIGNFLGHMIEYALRVLGDAAALARPQAALEGAFLALNTTASSASIQAYVTLTLARQIAISFQFPDRRAVTPALMALCEHRLALV